jgi:cell division transport system permease protein
MFGNGFLEAVTGNPLPASIRVRLESEGNLTARAREVAKALSGRKEVEGVDAGEAWLEALERFLRIASGAGVLLGSVLCLACGFAVSNVTKLMVLGQREAIHVMRLVGATGWYIRMTFLAGGCLVGCAGGVLAGTILALGAAWWTAWIPEIKPLPTGQTVPLLVLLGGCLGVLGSLSSLNRVLRAVTLR